MGGFASCLFVSLLPLPHPLGVHALTRVQVLATPLLLRLTLFLVSLLLKADSLGVLRAGGRPAIVHECPFVKRV